MTKEASMVRTLAAVSLLLIGTLSAADISEQRRQDLISRLASDGLAGRLAEALKNDWGRKALNERLDLIVHAPLTRARRNAHGSWEEHYFAADDLGRLVLRPERREEFERLKARRAHGLARFEIYSKRVDELEDRILEESELDKAAKAGWKERAWRIGLYNAYVSGGLPDSDHDLDQRVDVKILLWLMPESNGKLRVSEPGAAALTALMNEVYGLMDEVKKYEPSYLRLVAKADPATAKAASAEEVAVLACAKLAAEIRAGQDDALTRLLDLDPKEAVRGAEAALRAIARVKPRLDAVVAALSDQDSRSIDLKAFLSDHRARALLVHKLIPTEEAVSARMDWFFGNVLAGWFDAKDGKLAFKRMLFRSHTGDPTVEGFRAHTYGSWSFQLKGMQQLFLSTAERCADAQVAELLRDVEMLALLRQDETRIGELRAVAIQDTAVSAFLKLNFTEKDGKYVVRPDRTASIESLLARVEELSPKN